MTAASNSEARKRAAVASASVPRTWLAGIAASNPTDPEPTGTLEGAPGADSEALAAREADRAGLTAWFHRHFYATRCLHWGGGQSQCESMADAVLGSSWLADHDRQVAAAAWFAGYDKGNLDGHFGASDERTKSPYSDLDPYSKEARHG